MWISSRGEGDVIRIGGDITIQVLSVRSDRVVLELGSSKEEPPRLRDRLPEADKDSPVVRVRIAT